MIWLSSLIWLPCFITYSLPHLFCSHGSFQTHPDCFCIELLVDPIYNVRPQFLIFLEWDSPSFLHPLSCFISSQQCHYWRSFCAAVHICNFYQPEGSCLRSCQFLSIFSVLYFLTLADYGSWDKHRLNNQTDVLMCLNQCIEP